VKFPIGVCVDLDVGLIADFHVHDIVLIHIHARLHVTEISHAHYFRAGELPRRYDAFTQLAI
jgi:hypothetical protein